MGLNLFKRAKLENSVDIEQTLVTLPKSKVDKSIAECVELADKFINMHGYAANEHMVRLEDGNEMSVGDLAMSYNKKCNEDKERLAKEEEAKKNAEIQDPGEKKATADDKPADKTKNSMEEKSEEDKAKAKAHFDALKNAEGLATAMKDPVTVDMDKMARGKARYGSSN